MTPIINPWFIYLLSKLHLIQTLPMMVVLIRLLAISLKSMQLDGSPFDLPREYAKSKFFMVVLVFAVVAWFFTPSKETVIQMYVAKMITPDNVAMTKEAMLQFINETVQAIQGAL